MQLGGEHAYKKDVELYRERFSSDCILVHTLGSTEAPTFRCYFVDETVKITGNHVPSGYAMMPDMELLLLNEAGEEVGINETGEIAVRSRYLSLGYWRRPDLTNVTFLTDPDGEDEPICLTGDLGRLLPNGCLVHFGRKDFQVLVRGYRVEVAEVEMALLDRGDIKEVVVVGRQDRSGDSSLMAYIVLSRQPAPTVTSLRRFLLERLPEYMVPSAFVFLAALPMLLSGKVDRHALPEPGSARPRLGNPFKAPRTPVEDRRAEIRSEFLRLDQVCMHDNFMEFSGYSLMATQVVSRVIDTFRVDVPLRSMFDSPTIADMAVVIVQHKANDAEPELIEKLLSELEAISDDQANQAYVGDGS